MDITPPPITGTFETIGESKGVRVLGLCNVTLMFVGADATVALQRSFDGVNWVTLSKNSVPDKAHFTNDLDTVIEEPEQNVFYRWNCISHTSGTVDYRIGRSSYGHL